MPKLACPCGFVHNLSTIPDDGFLSIPDRDYEPFFDAQVKLQANPHDLATQRDADARWTSSVGRFYQCPTCGRLMWKRPGEKTYRIYHPEDPGHA